MPRRLCRLWFSPVVGLDAPLHGVEDGLRGESLFEGRPWVDTFTDALEQIVDCVGKGVLVANDVPRWPPVGGVRVYSFGDIDGAEPLQARGIVLEVDLQLVHAFEIEGDRPLRAIDFETVEVTTPRRQPRRLKCAAGPALEARQECGRIVDGDLAHLRPRLGR